MNAETKRHIDAARQVLVGVVPNPASQIDQITNALIYKFMDDMDQSAIKQGGEPSFFTGDLADYAWTRLMDTRIGNQERMNIYSEALVKFSESKQLPQLFREIFKSAFLPYRSPEVLGLFLKEIDYFDYSHPEELGNAYEYLLSIMSSQGDAGQFRTPRHIIDFIVDVINPTLEDKVLDPACGTGGFLVSAYKHIAEQHDGKNPDGTKNKEKPLTPDQRKNLMSNFEGYDIDPSMVRIAQVNMYLHQFKNPKIYNYDSLSMDERWGDKFSVILANPPFMSPKGGVSTHNKFSIQSTRSEVLFVDYIMNHLRPNGRAGIIVPEGIIFQSGFAHKQLRKNLLEEGLYAVISLPSGVFQPYTGVKTSILLFDNELIKRRNDILFIDIKDTGVSLGTTQKKIEKNDLIDALGIIKNFQKGTNIESSKLAFLATKQKIIDSGYDLSQSKYRSRNVINTDKKFVPISDVCVITKGKSSSTKTEPGDFPLYLMAEHTKTSKHYDFEGVGVCVPLMTAASTGKAVMKRIHFVQGKFALANLLAFVKPKDIEELDPRYLYYALNNVKDELAGLMKGAANVSMKTKDLEVFQIPLPSIEVQKQIVNKVDNYQNIIIGAKQIVTNWKPEIDSNLMWENVKLGTVCDYAGGTQPPKSTFIDSPKDGYVRLLQIRDYKSEKNATYISTSVRHKTCNENDIMIGRYGPPVFQILRGKAGAYNVALMKCLPDNSKITNDWLYYFLSSDPVQEKIISLSVRARQAGVNPADLNELVVPLPSLDIQKQIVERIESEHVLVESNKKLIELYEQKTKEVLARLWEE